MKRLCWSLLVLVVFGVNTSVQAITTFTFKATVTDNLYVGTIGDGTITYDETLGDGVFGPQEGLTLTLNLFGQTFTQLNDFDYDAWPQLEISGGVPVSLDFLIIEGVSVTINQPGVVFIHIEPGFTSFSPSSDPNYDFEIDVHAHGLPDGGATAILLGIGLLGIGALRRRS